MRLLSAIAVAAPMLIGPAAVVAQIPENKTPEPTPVHVELNTVEPADNHCRITFVIDNTTNQPIESLKLDLAVFNTQHIVQRRLLTELGPIRADKTMVKTFAFEGSCGDIGSILVNDVTCAPAADDKCLDHIALSSRVKNVKFFK